MLSGLTENKLAIRARRAPLTALLAVCLVAGLAACGDDYVAKDQPQIGGLRFEKITFDDVPRPDNSKLTTSGRVDGIDTELRSVPATSPAIIVSYYAEQLEKAGWEVENEPSEINGSGAWSGTWTQQGHDLVIDARFGDADEDGVVPTDYTMAMS